VGQVDQSKESIPEDRNSTRKCWTKESGHHMKDDCAVQAEQQAILSRASDSETHYNQFYLNIPDYINNAVISDYGVIGNMLTVALIALNSNIGWFCFPHFDSPSLFCGILDQKKGGHFCFIPRRLNLLQRCMQSNKLQSGLPTHCDPTGFQCNHKYCLEQAMYRQSDVNYKQVYCNDTNILISRFNTDDGVAQVHDFMPLSQSVSD
jgi:hypothetical protein